nr:MAG TPA: hypothetical protein [Caudoviricetes sp.]
MQEEKRGNFRFDFCCRGTAAEMRAERLPPSAFD